MMPRIFRSRLSRIDEHMKELLHGASIAFVLKVVAAGLSFGLSVVLARLLGAEGTGIFFLALTLVTILSAIGRLGMENSLVRFIAANISSGQPDKVLGVYQKAVLYSLIGSTILSLVLYSLVPWVGYSVFGKPELIEPLRVMAFAVVPLSLLTLHAFALQGLKKIAASTSVLSIYVPLVTCIVSIFFVPKYGINSVAWGYLCATALTLGLARMFWKSAIKPYEDYSPSFNRNELLRSSIPLFVVILMNMFILWSPMLFLGIWESSENIGIYSAASRTSMLISFILIAVNSIASPKYSALHQQGNMEAIGSLARNSAKIMALLASPILFLFVLAPEWVLSIFGDQFKQGGQILAILAVGQFINVTTGSVGYLLMMSGNEALMRNNMIFCAVIGIFLNLWLIPAYGVIGGAFAAAIVLSLQNLIAVLLVWKNLNIITIPWFGLGR